MKTPQDIVCSIIEALHTNPRAFALGMGHSYFRIYDICRGKTQILTNPVIKSIMETYHVRRSYLATGEGEMFDYSTPSTGAQTDDAITNSFLNVISTMSAELETQKKRVSELEEKLREIAFKHPELSIQLPNQENDNA